MKQSKNVWQATNILLAVPNVVVMMRCVCVCVCVCVFVCVLGGGGGQEKSSSPPLDDGYLLH